MDKMLYTAASGAARVMEAQTIRAHNLANAETTGFKADLERVNARVVAATGNSLQTRVMAQTESSGFSQQSGALNPTGRSLDLAIQEQGLFTVMTEQGEGYTRSGNITPDTNGQLTIDGRPVSGIDGPIVLPEYRELFVGDDGRISVIAAEGGIIEEVGRLKLVNPDLSTLDKGLDGLLYSRDGEILPINNEVRVDSGFLESSNVKAVNELIASMDLSRQFEIQVKLMKSAEKLAEAGNRLIRNA
ncbi:flagellar basal body rod protein FlgF [Shewanella eurypsychrophilus]|uniref:Flagellar basal-body rod protein FlgF n=1 Tax=Shewanella eurypsychrophilus TaxID=2593656 RepID=A0ABX6V0D6_9GAMM|nr:MULTISPECIES: flagellar basal body rod protein FlgF [Shewanella]QFU20475.1 flagellar hook-basal body complex protein [Shewanella sp. YLB-09]QFU20756.1 flagellar hook-basal body complex protein [Shewanella sp. YLB-09]QPG56052.1 flagellar basal body rod protein FlgF [Shewanella eurypsychrophilus]